MPDRYVDPEDTSAGVESCAVIVMERMEKSLNELLHAEKEVLRFCNFIASMWNDSVPSIAQF